MSPVMPFPNMDRARDEAAEWIARTFRGLTPEENAKLRDWARRPENRRAMQEMSGVWQGLDVLSVLSDVFPRDGRPATPASPPSPSRWRVALAASVMLVLTFGASFVAVRRHAAVASRQALAAALQAQVYSSAVGEHRSLRLDDGSTLELNSNTLVDVSFTPGLRSLNLHRGEAHFEVAHDATRPFLVTASGRTIRAVGTAFAIRRRGESELDVLVTEGIVSTYPTAAVHGSPESAPVDAARLSAGQLLHVRRDGSAQVERLSEAALDALTSWRRGVLVLDGITLEAALKEAARYTTRRIVIADPGIASVRLGGSFPTDDLSPLFRSLQANFGIETHEDADGTLRLTRATPRR